MSDHASLTGADLHESKGASTASANFHAVADGAGSTTWQKLKTNEIDITNVFGVNQLVLTVLIPEVGTADTVYVVVPCACTLTKVYSVLYAAITGADSNITIQDHGGNVAGTFPVAQSGSAAGDIDFIVLNTNNVFTSGQRVRVITDGAATGPAELNVTLVFTVTGVIS